ncbi:4-diphosphocytidyl-2C-methyl-D-erythritol synthase [Knoellia sinensis KCTC 19936]|uniref:4-diphosphocytidyl-2C-methyl-D-erythritol synthase n=1 Tax=Knoellia sinensis KCTC 19936 TaxID=1385520 RepID=A0A0A0JAI3_9MICO|nr:nucleotidyltransferase family protein [Knoellia sinensis]KGN33824.1 4-diphosphocytidyl-2C-methyl-D-erythritol synthase [Knoellia sinensis KCTC 19936]
MADARVVGLVLAAGAGRRMGGPKALLRLSPTGPSLVEMAVERLQVAGVADVHVVVGSAAPNVTARAERAGGHVVEAPNWDEGMGASLRAGLDVLQDTDARAVLLMLVDLPDVGVEVHERLLGAVDGDLDGVLARAAYDGRAGHPVLIGRDHWAPVRMHATGDHGARDYLDRHRPHLVECGDLATGRDIDRPCDV